MGKPILLLRLEGPLQSWGSRSRWDVRDTQPEPTKSGVLGLLGCALGYERGDRRLLELDAGLRFGVRVEAPGRVLEDYHTITDFLPTAAGDFKVLGGTKSAAALRSDPDARPATIISPRFYLEDAAFLAALEATNGARPDLLQECAQAIQNPRWTLFLGRKACVPTRPIFEALMDRYDGLEDALCHHPWSWQGSPRPRPAGALMAYVEDPAGPLTRQDALRLNAARVYDFRRAHALAVPFPGAQEEP
ncbi:MAG: type I-E CRISPR-associated protein Cas5/CasD [Armatimonadetes bacterium]|nr:type I-E CRISPR-associated protein Cas5/CasD [Armatimonadota bacterium]